MSGSDPAHPVADASGLDSQARLMHRLSELEQEKNDLQLMLDMAIEHSDTLLESLRQENQELTLQLEHTTGLIKLRGEQQTVEPFQLVTEALPIGLMIARIVDGHIVYGNSATCQLLGVSVEQLKTQKITDFCHDSVSCEQLISVMLNQQTFAGTLRWSQSNGKVFHATVSLQPFMFKDEPALLTIIQTVPGPDQ